MAIVPKILLSAYVSDDVSFSWYYVFETIFNPRLNVWGHFWFLPTLLIIYIVSYAILKCYNSKWMFSLLTALTFVLAVFPINTDWLAVKDICKELVYFCIGIASCNIIIQKKDRFFKMPVAFAATAFAVAFYIFICLNNFYSAEINRNITTVVIALPMIYTVLFVSVSLEKIGCKMLDYLDGKTFTVYIISWPCQAATEVILNRLMHLHWYITLPAMFVMGLALPLLFLWVYNKFKYHPKFINLVFGVG